MVEKTRDFFGKLPGWWPVFAACVWLIWSTAQWHADVMNQLKTQEDQIKAIQEYLKNDHNHQKGDSTTPEFGLSYTQQQPPQDAAQPQGMTARER